MKKSRSITSKLPAALALVVVAALWCFASEGGWVPAFMLPSPRAVVQALLSDAPVLAANAAVTLQEAAWGLLIGIVVALVLSTLMHRVRWLYRALYPILVITQTIPTIAIAPLLVLWMGFGMAPKILMVIFMCFFPIAISFTEALAQCDEEQISLLKSFGASTVQIYRMVKIPSAASALFSGLQVSATYCIGGAIVGEWLSAAAGLGYYMIRVKNGYMLDKVFACVVVIIVLSLLLNLAMKLLERIIFPHVQRRRNKE